MKIEALCHDHILYPYFCGQMQTDTHISRFVASPPCRCDQVRFEHSLRFINDIKCQIVTDLVVYHKMNIELDAYCA